jgi:hypothetical protein
MKNLTTTTIALLLAGGANAADIRLLPAENGDLAPATLTRTAAKALPADLERAPVAVSWVLDPREKLAVGAPERQLSKEYWLEATSAELSKGVLIHTTAPGALVRINPVDPADKAAAIGAGDVTIRTASGQSLRGAEAFGLAVGDADLKAAGAGFADGTLALRLAADVGDGAITIAAPAAKASRGYVVHVLDQASDISFGARAMAYDLVGGDTLRVRAGVDKAGAAIPAGVGGFVTSPDGAIFELEFRAVDGLSVARLPLADCTSSRPGLWEVHASARAEVAGEVALRSVRTAFSCAEATARLTGEARLGGPSMAAGDLIARLGVEAAVAGRYEIRGVLYGTAPSGELVPAAMAHSAAWLEPGTGELRLIVDAATLAATGVGRPLEIRDLTLIDQGRMGVIHRQARGLVIHD